MLSIQNCERPTLMFFAKFFVRILLFLSAILIIELVFSSILSLFVSEKTYLRWYLGDVAIAQTDLFVKNKHSILIPSNVTGWENRPSYRLGKWKIDEFGARSISNVSKDKKKNTRVVFLGSSTMNGSTTIDNSETISAYAEDENIETLNFGTMMFSLDQILLQYRFKIRELNPDIVVVGIEADLDDSLTYMYVPFYAADEINMPFIKPRFRLNGESLELVAVDPIQMLRSIFESENTLSFLSRNDDLYAKFTQFKFLGLLPICNLVSGMFQKIKTLYEECFISERSTADRKLKERIITQLIKEIKSDGGRPILLPLASRPQFAPEGVYRIFRDTYTETQRSLDGLGAHVLDIRAILKASGLSAEEIYFDQVHYWPKANRIIGEAIRKEIHAITNTHP